MNYRLLCVLCVLISAVSYTQDIKEQSQKVDQQSEESVLIDEVKDVETFSWTASFGQYTAQQIAAFVAGSLIVGYGAYKVYQAFVARYFPYSIQLTAKERDILLALTETMEQDVKQVRTGSRKPSLVKGFDMSGLSTPLNIECRYWQHNFVMLYNQCETNTQSIDLLDSFYADFNNAIRDLISKARII